MDQELFREYVKAAMEPGSCPTEEEWMAWVSGKLTPARKEELSAHAERCANCRATLDDAALFASPAEAQVPVAQDYEAVRRRLPVVMPSRAPSRRPWIAFGAAAASVLVMAGVLWQAIGERDRLRARLGELENRIAAIPPARPDNPGAVQLLELFAAQFQQRSGGKQEAARVRREGMEALTLLLHADGFPSAGALHVRIAGPDQSIVWEGEASRRAADGILPLNLKTRDLKSGIYRIHVTSPSGAARDYELAVE
jgi:hypothetical protein